MRGFTKTPPEVLERERERRREEARAKGYEIVARHQAAYEARLAELRARREREKAQRAQERRMERRRRRAQMRRRRLARKAFLVSRLRQVWDRTLPEAFV